MDEQMEREKLRYESREPLFSKDMELGREFAPFEYPITAQVVADIADGTGVGNALYSDPIASREQGHDRPIAPQACSMIYGRQSFMGHHYRPAPGGIAASLSFRFAKPAAVGDVITSRAKVIANEERKGRKYVTVRSESLDQRGDLISTMDFTFILPS